MTYAAPNLAGQADVIAEAHAVADVDSSTIRFVETHGTGTPLGDPIEIEALRQAFGSPPRPGPARVLGSVKSNFGHLDEASGIAGLIKTILCLKNRAIPPTVHYTAPNPELHLENTPFVVQSKYTPWESDGTAPGRGELFRCRRHQRARRRRGGAADLRRPRGSPVRSAGAAVVSRNHPVHARCQGRTGR